MIMAADGDGSDWGEDTYSGPMDAVIECRFCNGTGATSVKVERCPKCGAEDVYDGHHEGTFSIPECTYKQCYVCHHQWGHA
jgi:hypothetical protein